MIFLPFIFRENDAISFQKHYYIHKSIIIILNIDDVH
jgi:hypothetical protein